ncbi:hypothetical protein ACFLT2_01390 [Acidobacteriota bacterium]
MKKKNQKGDVFSFYFETNLKQQLEKVAKEDDRSLSWLINHAVRKLLEERQQ